MKTPAPLAAPADVSSTANFLAAVSHELRTPLQTILGYGELLQRDATDDLTRARLDALCQHGALMLRIVNDLLDLAALHAGGFRIVERPVALAPLLAQTVESFRPRVEAKGLALTCSLDAALPAWLLTDGDRVRQIALNLIANAEKFTARGRIEVVVRALPADPAAPGAPTGDAAGAEADACAIEIAVRDTGPGIAAADQAKLFRPFSRLDGAAGQEGAGLGLALTGELCRRLGGGLALESDGRTGSCFRARLSMRRAAAPAIAPARLFPALRGRRVLVADDNPLVRELFAHHFRALGAECAVVSNGAAALQRLAERRFDVLVLDWAMPGIDGMDVTRRLRAQHRADLRIVGVSAHVSPRDRAQAMAAGMNALLPKPVDLAALAEAVGLPPGGRAPRADDREIRRALRKMFRRDVANQVTPIVAALAESDWPGLKHHVHYLRGSASVVGDERLRRACGALESAADRRDAAATASAWETCRAALAGWLDRPAPARGRRPRPEPALAVS